MRKMRKIKNIKMLVTGNEIKMFVSLILLIAILTDNSFAQQQIDSNSKSEKSTTLAVLLSLQPLPIDFGNYYAGYTARAIEYTAGQLLFFVPGIIMLTNGSNESDEDKIGIYVAFGGYILMKVFSAFDVSIRLSLDNRRSLTYSLNGNRALVNFSIEL